MGRFEYGRRYRRRRRRRQILHLLPLILAAVILIGGGGYGIYRLTASHKLNQSGGNAVILANGENGEPANPDSDDSENPAVAQTDETDPSGSPDAAGTDADNEPETAAEPQTPLEQLLAEADALASGYDYDAAIERISSDAEFADTPEAAAAIAGYEETKAALIRADISEITHVFFHSLIVDPSKAFDDEADQDGYNQVMTTVDEFKKILQSMYEKGYVLVRLHDMAYETTDESGNTVMKAGDILLPEGKKPFVMSQDDLCYYSYMDGDGFASRMIIGEDGYPTCEMDMEDGSVSVGSYDLIPILEDFIREHPDFSYRGARAVIAFTGYEGILGYRTASSYAESNPNYQQDRETAAQVAQCLREHGWELASHSWGHLNLGKVEWDRFRTDCDNWESEVESLIGTTDIILFPFGADVNDWHVYSHDNERYDYLYRCGFRYYCNVDASSQYWVQLGTDSLRQGRRNLDGYRMWQDMTAEAEGRERRLEDLFHAEDVFDAARPTPVPEM
ncbi:MAG: polysaccharide deacetylase [Clostridiales bacterium]|nr:polysaccharide deacetylase [Clostridiales bacterium]